MMQLTYIGAGNMGMAVCSAAALSGWNVKVVDINPEKVALINAGRSPVPEDHTEDAMATGRIKAVSSLPADSDLIAIGVDTPVDGDGEPIYSSLMRALESIPRPRPCPVVINSTIFPGARAQLERLLDPGDVYQPVFLRAGTGTRDFMRPGQIVLGGLPDATERVFKLIRYFVPGFTEAKVHLTTWELAEWTKVLHNAFFTAKICFANEWGEKAKAAGLDPAAVLALMAEGPNGRLFTQSHMIPGLPYSGPCLPKDARWAYNRFGGTTRCDLISACYTSRQEHVAEIVRMALLRRCNFPPGPIGIAGLSFKADFVEVRASLACEIHQRLTGIRYNLSNNEIVCYDPAVVAMRDRYGVGMLSRGDPVACTLIERCTDDINKLAACSVVIPTRPDMAHLEK